MELLDVIFGDTRAPLNTGQMCARAALIFAYAATLYRLAPRKTFGSNSVIDAVLVVTMGSSLSRALTGTVPLLPTLAATAVLVAIHIVLSHLARRSRRVADVLKGDPIDLVRGGHFDEAGMRAAALRPEDVEASVRIAGVPTVSEVALARLEQDGSISVIRSPESERR